LICQRCAEQGHEFQQAAAELDQLNQLPLTAAEQRDLNRSLATVRSFYQQTIQSEDRSVFSVFKSRLFPLTAGLAAAAVVIAGSLFVYWNWRMNQRPLPGVVAKVELPQPAGPSVEPSPFRKEKEGEKQSNIKELLSKKKQQPRVNLLDPDSQPSPTVELDVEEVGERGGQMTRRQQRVLKVPNSGTVNLRIRLSEESRPGPYVVRLENVYFDAVSDGVNCESFDGKQLSASLNLKQFKSGAYYIGVFSKTGATQHVEVRLVSFK
jgi:hypothetical protein